MPGRFEGSACRVGPGGALLPCPLQSESLGVYRFCVFALTWDPMSRKQLAATESFRDVDGKVYCGVTLWETHSTLKYGRSRIPDTFLVTGVRLP